ncbi:MAG: hypothetical protein LBB68_01825 [Treponema sp.]|nr:hypothetical protein [Treponema sp.]
MKITIDGKPADIILENEKTIGDLLREIGNWLSGSQYSLSGLSINDETINAASVNDALDRPLDSIETLDIRTASLPLLMAEALVDIRQDITAYGNASFEDQKRLQREWEKSPPATFLAEHIPDMFDCINRSFRGEGLGIPFLIPLVDERLRELRDPRLELGGMDVLIETTAKRLEDLPLDIQTGKDTRAAETVQLFSNITEKLFRILSLLRLEGIITDTLVIDTMPFNAFIGDFSAALKELLAAYEVKDAVLVGDLAEYELAPRLRTFYSAIRAPVTAA